MASKITSIARKVGFYHKPKDGKCPVYNPASQNWTYLESPSAEQLDASADRMITLDANSLLGISKAQTAQRMAETAQATADEVQETVAGKVSLSEVQNSLFPASDINEAPVVMDRLEFVQGPDGWGFQFCYHPMFKPEMGTCATLAYVRKSTFDALVDRVAALEGRLGIS